MNLGRYETFDRIGTGSMGTVYRARDTLLNRYVALKVMRCGPEVEPELRERFYREAWTCARLTHPGIVAVLDLGECDDSAYIAMELLFGNDFRKIIDKRLELPLDAKIEAIAQVCDALAHAHRGGILHRDVKPSNLFLTEGRIAKVLDFGMARLPGSNLTSAGRPLGTPIYMAPEQIRGAATGERSDLFSAAVVLFELLVYTHPFQGDEIPRRIVQAEPASLFAYDPRLPAELERVLARGLSKEPQQRFATGDEFAAALRAILAPRPGTAEPARSDSPVATPSAARKACRYCGASNRAAALYCIQCGGRLSLPQEPPPPPQPPATPRPRAPLPLTASELEATTVTLSRDLLDASVIVPRPEGLSPVTGDLAPHIFDEPRPAPSPFKAGPLTAEPAARPQTKQPRRMAFAYVLLAAGIGLLLLWTFWLRSPQP